MSLNPLGFVLPALSIGFGAIQLKPLRAIRPYNTEGEALASIIAQITIEERHSDELEITEHPVEQGAAIADHAFKRPAEVMIRCAWSNSPSAPGSLISQAVGLGAALGGRGVAIAAAALPTLNAAQSLLSGNDQNQIKNIYQQLLQLQADRVPFDILTGKRAYTSMLMRSLSQDTDANTENVLAIVMVCRQVIIVQTQTVVVSNDARTMKEPEKTSPTTNFGLKNLLPAPKFRVPSLPFFDIQL